MMKIGYRGNIKLRDKGHWVLSWGCLKKIFPDADISKNVLPSWGYLKKEFSRTESQNIVLMSIIQRIFESFAKVLSQ